MDLTFEEYRKKIEKLNGANIILADEEGKIYSFKANYGNKKRMLFGGSLERNELPHHAAQSECEEEGGVYPTNASLKLVGVFMQRIAGIPDVRGYNFLYYSNEWQGKFWSSNEGDMPEPWTPKQIFARRDEFDTSYLRMIVHYLLWKENPVVSVKRLSEPVSILFEGELITV